MISLTAADPHCARAASAGAPQRGGPQSRPFLRKCPADAHVAIDVITRPFHMHTSAVRSIARARLRDGAGAPAISTTEASR